MKIKQADSFFYRIPSNISENALCSTLNSNKQNILRNNNNLCLYAGEWVKVTTNNYCVHIVKPIESLTSIAQKYNTSVDKLLADNALKTDKLFIGQQLKIFNK